MIEIKALNDNEAISVAATQYNTKKEYIGILTKNANYNFVGKVSNYTYNLYCANDLLNEKSSLTYKLYFLMDHKHIQFFRSHNMNFSRDKKDLTIDSFASYVLNKLGKDIVDNNKQFEAKFIYVYLGLMFEDIYAEVHEELMPVYNLYVEIEKMVDCPISSLINKYPAIYNEAKRCLCINEKYESAYKVTYSETQPQDFKRIGEYKNFCQVRMENAKNDLTKFIESTNSNITLFPYMSNIMSDVLTSELSLMINQLSWGDNQERKQKVQSLLEIRKQVKEQLTDAKISYYQLQYLLNLYPSLQDVLDSEYNEVKFEIKDFDYEHTDPIRLFITKEEWDKLSVTERNQLALDRYVLSRSKNNWQIGRDYELYIGQEYLKNGYSVDFTGSYLGVEDMGRDLICKKDDETLIIQCKFWGKNKTIHENHINQLYGTMVSYAIENNLSNDKVKGIFITNIELSPVAKEFAKRLHIVVKENIKMEDFPRIKCNISLKTNEKIYHLPMDLSYDVAKIVNKGECFVRTVKEAEELGFRRSYKWHGGIED